MRRSRVWICPPYTLPPDETGLDIILSFRTNCIFPSHVRSSHYPLGILFSSHRIHSGMYAP